MKNNITYLSILFISIILVSSCKSTDRFSSENVKQVPAIEHNSPQVDNHNGFISLDWQGEYIGLEYCSDCMRKRKVVTLRGDDSYEVLIEYIGSSKPLIQRFTGRIIWNAEGNEITLQNDNPDIGYNKFKVEENRLLPIGDDVKLVLGSEYMVKVESIKLTHQRWLLVEVMDTPVRVDINESNQFAHMELVDKGRVHGYAGCNNFSGEYSLTGRRGINFDKVVATRKMCRDMTVEDNYLTVFENTASYEIVKGELLLRDKNGEIIARFISL